MISFSGEVKIADFGFASLMGDATEEVRGTPSYLAPEQVRGESLSAACDLFSIGAIFFEMLAGHLAFPGETTGDILDAILNDAPGEKLYDMSNVPPEVAALCNRLLSKTPDARYVTAADVSEELQALRNRSITPAILEQYIADPHGFKLKTSGSASRVDDTAIQDTIAVAPQSEVFPVRHRFPQRAAGAILAIVLFGALLITGIRAFTGDSSGVESAGDPAVSNPRDPVGLTPVNNDEQIDLESSAKTNDSLDEKSTDTEAGSPQPTSVERPSPEEELTLRVPERPVNQDVVAPAGTSPVNPPIESSGQISTESVDNAPGRLLVDSVPWATVYIDGDSVATTPLRAPISIPSGTHTVILRHPEFPDYNTVIDVEAGQQANLNVSLYALVGQIYLEISPWAEIIIDEVVRDTIPPQERPLLLAAGEYSLRLRHPSLGVWETSILVEAGKTQRLRYNLNELLSQ